MPRRRFLPQSAAFVVLSMSIASSVRADDVPPPAPPPMAAASEGVVFEPGTPAFADVLAKSKAEGKPAFIDFATDWCGWCKKLDKDVYTQASVGEAMKAFVNVRVDAEKGEGVALAKRFGVHGFPTLLIVDSNGNEIDRIVGYLPPKEFTTEIGRIVSGDGTIPALTKQFAAKSDDVDTGLMLGKKLAPSRCDEAAELFTGLVAKTKDHDVQGAIHLEAASALLGAGKAEAAAKEAETVVLDFADTPSARDAAARVGPAFVRLDSRRALAFLDAASGIAKESQERAVIDRLTIAVHKSAIAASLKRQAEAAGDDPQLLNEAAWNCFEEKANLKEALGWAKTAVEKSNRDPAILDTLANLLWLTGDHAEAIKIEKEAADHSKGAMKKEFVGNIAKWTIEAKASKDDDGEEEDGDDEDDDKDEKKDAK